MDPIPLKEQLLVDEFAKFWHINLKDHNIYADVKGEVSLKCFIFNMDVKHFSAEVEVIGPIIDNIKNVENWKINKDGSFFIKDNRIAVRQKRYFEQSFLNCFDNVMNKYKWKSTMIWDSSEIAASRPIRHITVIINKKFLSHSWNGINFGVYQDNSPTFNEKKAFLEKIIYDQFLDRNKIVLFEEIINNQIGSLNFPVAAILAFDSKFLELPTDLLHYFFYKEVFAIPIHSNQYMIFLEKKCDSSLTIYSINEKLEDLLLIWKIDIENVNLEEKSNNCFLGHCTIKEKKERMAKIIHNTNLNNKENILNMLKFYFLDYGSLTVQKYPLLIGVVTKHIYHLSIDKLQMNIIKAIDYIDNLEELDLPTSKSDPFGLKKQIDYIAKLILEYKFDLNLSKKLEPVILKKILIMTNKSLFNIQSIRDFFSCQLDINHIEKQDIIRIFNFDFNPSEKCSITNNELELEKECNELTFNTISNTIKKIINYINTTTINPYIERIKIIESFKNSFIRLVNYKDFMEKTN